MVVPGLNDRTFAGLPVAAGLEDMAPFDAVMVTDISAPPAAYDMLRQRLEEEQILILPLLHVNRVKAGARKA